MTRRGFFGVVVLPYMERLCRTPGWDYASIRENMFQLDASGRVYFEKSGTVWILHGREVIKADRTGIANSFGIRADEH